MQANRRQCDEWDDEYGPFGVIEAQLLYLWKIPCLPLGNGKLAGLSEGMGHPNYRGSQNMLAVDEYMLVFILLRDLDQTNIAARMQQRWRRYDAIPCADDSII
jgi:hypothetical protein